MNKAGSGQRVRTLEKMGGGKEDVGRIKFRVKDDVAKSGTNHRLEFGKRRDGSEKGPGLKRFMN